MNIYKYGSVVDTKNPVFVVERLRTVVSKPPAQK